MRHRHNREGVIQAEKSLRALEHTGGMSNQGDRDDEERALRQMISGIIIPEWQETSDRGKRGSIEIMKLWTGDMMDWARMQMKKWMEKKNEHIARIQRRWENRGITKDAFQKWKSLTHNVDIDKGQVGKETRRNKEKTYGIKHWGR
eukprot:3821710-Pleurochrysis_carterae.AAC.1